MPDDAILTEEAVHAALAEAVINLDLQRTGELAQMVLDRGWSARRAILEGLSEGMRRVGDKFCSHEFFVPEVVVASRAMYRGFNLLKPAMLEEGGAAASISKGRVVIAVVQGDLHDIGKNIVRLLLEADGFAVDDLGKNVSPELVLASLEKIPGDDFPILALSTLMTSTMDSMRRTVEAARDRHPQIKIMVGGAPVSEAFSRDLGADGTAAEAAGAVKLARLLAGQP